MSRTRWGNCLFCVVLPLVALTVGCGSPNPVPEKLPTVPTSGKVTFNGRPIDKGTLTFVPAGPNDGRGEKASISAGTYQTEDGRGLVAGNYLVIVQIPQVNVAEPEKDGENVEPPPEIPAKYADPRTTDLTLKVTKEDRSLVKDFELRD